MKDELETFLRPDPLSSSQIIYNTVPVDVYLTDSNAYGLAPIFMAEDVSSSDCDFLPFFIDALLDTRVSQSVQV
jgi:hypothetical protein